MRVLITGICGFVGSHVAKTIAEQTDWEIVGLDRLDFASDIQRMTWMSRPIEFLWWDLKAELNPQIAARIGEVDYILHLAASSHVDRSITDPLSFVMDNVVGTCNILNFARTLPNLKRFIYFSTDEVFGPAPVGVDFEEYDRYNSTNPYSASKAGGEELCVAYHNTYKLPIYITHTMNVFGEWQHPEKYIPKCVQSIMGEKVITVHANKDRNQPGMRHYIHAQDVAEGLLFLLDRDFHTNRGGCRCPKFNLVGLEEVDNLQVAQKIATHLGKELHYEMVDFHSARPGHDLRYSLSGELMRDLGWQPKQTFSERIGDVVDWYINFWNLK